MVSSPLNRNSLFSSNTRICKLPVRSVLALTYNSQIWVINFTFTTVLPSQLLLICTLGFLPLFTFAVAQEMCILLLPLSCDNVVVAEKYCMLLLCLYFMPITLVYRLDCWSQNLNPAIHMAYLLYKPSLIKCCPPSRYSIFGSLSLN